MTGGPQAGQEPLLDVVLRPGTVLYIPPGFGHDTQTTPEALDATTGGVAAGVGVGRPQGAADDGSAMHANMSVHATVGCYARRLMIDYAGARYTALVRAGLPPASTGFVAPRRADSPVSVAKAWRGLAGQMVRRRGPGGPDLEDQSKTLRRLVREAEPERWRGHSNADLHALLNADQTPKLLALHVSRLVDAEVQRLGSRSWPPPTGEQDPFDHGFASFAKGVLGGSSCAALVDQLGCAAKLGERAWIPIVTVGAICREECRGGKDPVNPPGAREQKRGEL